MDSKSLTKENEHTENHDQFVSEIQTFHQEDSDRNFWKSKSTMLQEIHVTSKSLVELLKVNFGWYQHLYKKFTQEYKRTQPLAEELITRMWDVQNEKKELQSMINKNWDISEQEKDKIQKEIKEMYEHVESFLVPIPYRLKKLEDIIHGLKKELWVEEWVTNVFSFELNFIDTKRFDLNMEFLRAQIDISLGLKIYAVYKEWLEELPFKLNTSPNN